MITTHKPASGEGCFFKGLVWAFILVSPFWFGVLWLAFG
jgi:hypothetical protein